MPFEGTKCVNKTVKNQRNLIVKFSLDGGKLITASKKKTGKISFLNNENSNNLYFNNKHEYLCQQ